MKKFLALVLSLCMVFSLAAVASAAEIDADGGSGSTPVYLSSTADGSIGGDPAPTAMSVTIPTGLPMAMSQSGDVTTADNCQIVNHSYGAVRVRSVSISAVDGWKLTAFGDKSSLAHEKGGFRQARLRTLHWRRRTGTDRRFRCRFSGTLDRAHDRLLSVRRR